jgi:SAM-dependent methyltransferase
VDGLFTHVLPAADGLCDALASGIDVLHVGCESGRALPLLARQFPRSRFLGIDSRIAPIARAKQDAAERRLANLRFERCDVTDLARPGVYGLVLGLDGAHDHARPEEALAAIAGALRHEGRFVLRDVSGTGRLETDAQLPLAAFLYTISCLHGLTVSLADDGAGLGTMWSEETARQMLAGAGFADVVVRPLPDDPVNRYYLARRAS